MKDYMYLALATDDGVRGYAAATTHLVEEARQLSRRAQHRPSGPRCHVVLSDFECLTRGDRGEVVFSRSVFSLTDLLNTDLLNTGH